MPRDGERRPWQDRLWEKVDRSGGPDACWPFSGAHHEDGYGYITIWLDGKWRHAFGAHRAAYMDEHGLEEPPAGTVRHTCDFPPCCNPRHLRLGSVGDNVRDCVAKGRHRYQENPQRGEANGRAKVTEDQVREIRSLVAAGMSKAAAGRQFGISDGQVGHIVRRRSWPNVE